MLLLLCLLGNCKVLVGLSTIHCGGVLTYKPLPNNPAYKPWLYTVPQFLMGRLQIGQLTQFEHWTCTPNVVDSNVGQTTNQDLK